MYESFYHLREKPFTLLPDPGFLYMSGKHRMALTLLEYSLMNHAGFTVISGEIGAGKTTLIRQILSQMDREHTVGLISTTHRSFGELLQWILLAFNLDHANMGKVEMYQRFIEFIIDEYAHNKSVVLIVDEAQNMPAEVLEELRMLSNINADKDQALQVILVGQRELRETLQRPELAQFAQRISVDYHLQPLSEDETIAYIQHRLQVAGGDPGIFEIAACRAVYRYSNGVPRLINVLCDTALVYGYAEQALQIDAQLVTDVAYEKQQGGIFPVFEPAVKEAVPATAVTGSEARTDAQTAFADELAEYVFTADESHEPSEPAAAADTPPETGNDDVRRDTDSRSTTDPEPAAAQPAAETTHHRGHRDANRKIRVALCSAHDGFRVYLSKLLKTYGIDVVMSEPLYEEILAAMDPDEFDVLLIDRDEYAATQPAELEHILANWRGPLLYNDTLAMKNALRQGNYSFGKTLARNIEALAGIPGEKTGT